MESSRPNRPRPTPKKHALDNEEHRFIPVSTYSQIRRQRLSRVCFIALLAYFVGGWFGEFGLGNSGIVVGDNDFNFKDKDWKERGEVNGVMLYDDVGKNAPGKITPLRGTIIVNLHVGYIMDVLLNINRSKGKLGLFWWRVLLPGVMVFIFYVKEIQPNRVISQVLHVINARRYKGLP